MPELPLVSRPQPRDYSQRTVRQPIAEPMSLPRPHVPLTMSGDPFDRIARLLREIVQQESARRAADYANQERSGWR
ncbi:MAG: hypothetical protein KF812_02220 [Fimbriimonadaceae bacterium]|nr:hypothetical protein [Fimbriimonadaceae bacterium]